MYSTSVRIEIPFICPALTSFAMHFVNDTLKKEAEAAVHNSTGLYAMSKQRAALVRKCLSGAGETSALPLAALSIVENTVPFPDAVPSLTRQLSDPSLRLPRQPAHTRA
ncbi:hypothetical protein FA95DRAFT_1565254 [Auriscalpium vulgare]|uniref:Uncharacterized protein n=1 Tax=Auriscalpium vulgare TaxID=40419 RepID=A0ACB8RCG8_9AGAM|nr:hypothetical protein FA95DRAFT_1565254 [Auriscalpium vulgare]